MRRIPRIICMMLAMLWLPVSGISGGTGITAKQPAEKRDAQTPNNSQSRTDSLSQGEPVKPLSQKENDVKSRGLFSKKKKKKTTGGGSAHTEPEKDPGRQPDDADGTRR
jgi:hypothetical protein